MPRSRSMLILSIGLLLAVAPEAVHAQTPPPTPGPTNPNPPTTPGETKSIVINPTTEQCKQGWSSGMQWTKEQFDKYCAQINLSK